MRMHTNLCINYFILSNTRQLPQARGYIKCWIKCLLRRKSLDLCSRRPELLDEWNSDATTATCPDFHLAASSQLKIPERSRSFDAEENTQLLRPLEETAAIEQMRSWLRERNWLEEENFFTDEYIHTAMHANKNGKQRTFEYTALKLQQSLKWRRDFCAAGIKREDVSR